MASVRRQLPQTRPQPLPHRATAATTISDGDGKGGSSPSAAISAPRVQPHSVRSRLRHDHRQPQHLHLPEDRRSRHQRHSPVAPTAASPAPATRLAPHSGKPKPHDRISTAVQAAHGSESCPPRPPTVVSQRCCKRPGPRGGCEAHCHADTYIVCVVCFSSATAMNDSRPGSRYPQPICSEVPLVSRCSLRRVCWNVERCDRGMNGSRVRV